MLTFKQIELGNILFEKVREKYPELKLVSITESAENPNNVWVNVITPEDEDKEIEIREFGSEIATDILLEHGCLVMIMSECLPEQLRKMLALAGKGC